MVVVRAKVTVVDGPGLIKDTVLKLKIEIDDQEFGCIMTEAQFQECKKKNEIHDRVNMGQFVEQLCEVLDKCIKEQHKQDPEYYMCFSFTDDDDENITSSLKVNYNTGKRILEYVKVEVKKMGKFISKDKLCNDNEELRKEVESLKERICVLEKELNNSTVVKTENKHLREVVKELQDKNGQLEKKLKEKDENLKFVMSQLKRPT